MRKFNVGDRVRVIGQDNARIIYEVIVPPVKYKLEDSIYEWDDDSLEFAPEPVLPTALGSIVNSNAGDRLVRIAPDSWVSIGEHRRGASTIVYRDVDFTEWEWVAE